MRRFFAVLLLTLLLSSAAFAHPGGTDSQGGHHVTATGEYHYHHGYPAHQHPNGVCEYKLNTISSNTQSSSVSSSTADTPSSARARLKEAIEKHRSSEQKLSQTSSANNTASVSSSSRDRLEEIADKYISGEYKSSQPASTINASISAYAEHISVAICTFVISCFLVLCFEERRWSKRHRSEISSERSRSSNLLSENRLLKSQVADLEQKLTKENLRLQETEKWLDICRKILIAYQAEEKQPRSAETPDQADPLRERTDEEWESIMNSPIPRPRK